MWIISQYSWYGSTQSQSGWVNPVALNENTSGNTYYRWQVRSWEDFEVESLADQASENLKRKEKIAFDKAVADRKKSAQAGFYAYQNEIKGEMKILEWKLKSWNATAEEIAKYRDNSKLASTDFSELTQGQWDAFSWYKKEADQPIASNATPRANPTPGVTPPQGTTPSTPPEKNPPNVYDTQSGKIYDASAIPTVLQGGKIRPERYFLQNGLNWMRDRKRIAQEAGIENYTGTPGENYAMVQYLEDKKSWSNWGEWALPTRKFDGIEQSTIPNRFSQDDVAKMQSMTPEERLRFIQQRNVEDLKKALPWNVELINKVFGTKYTSDDLTGGIGRATVLWTGMPSKGMEIQNLINGLDQATADKFMSKWAELDNAWADKSRIGTDSVQSWRRKILEDMVDGRIPMWQWTTLDDKDQEYMNTYKDYKVQQTVANRYNGMIQKWNSTSDTTIRLKYGKEIRDYINSIRDANPEVYESMKSELDRIPTILQSGGKLTAITPKNPGEGQKTPTTNPGITINKSSTGTINSGSTIPGGTPQTASESTPTNPNKWGEEMGSMSGWVIKEPDQKAPNDEGRYGYSSNAISQW